MSATAGLASRNRRGQTLAAASACSGGSPIRDSSATSRGSEPVTSVPASTGTPSRYGQQLGEPLMALVQALAPLGRQVRSVQAGEHGANGGRPRRAAARHVPDGGLVEPETVLHRVD